MRNCATWCSMRCIPIVASLVATSPTYCAGCDACAAFYGSRPQFICTSATIANPRNSPNGYGSGRSRHRRERRAPGRKALHSLQPADLRPRPRAAPEQHAGSAGAGSPLCAGQTCRRSSLDARDSTTELLLTYLRDRVGQRQRAVAGFKPGSVGLAIRGYRGGYLPAERRAIEAGLRAAKCAPWSPPMHSNSASTSAICRPQFCAAIPGRIASTWQQMGRAGRTVDAALGTARRHRRRARPVRHPTS